MQVIMRSAMRSWSKKRFLLFRLTSSMRRNNSRKCFVLCFSLIIGYMCYRFSSIWFLEDIRDRAVLKARAHRQLDNTNTLEDPTGLACRHPELDAADPILARYFTKNDPLLCSPEPDWVCVEKGHAFLCNETLLKLKDTHCTYTFLERTSDFKTSDGVVVTTKEKSVPLRSDFFRVSCQASGGEQWTNIMAGIKPDPKVLTRAGWQHLPSEALGLNVLMWGFDSLSRMTFIRKLPRSYKYLTEVLNAIVLKGYNIVGDGTPQALIPMFTGKTELELPETRKRMGSSAQFVNVYPFLWKDFQKYGYVTAFAEDCPSIGTFTYRLTGFNEQPTDHYMRTFYVAAEDEYSRHPAYCLGSLPRHKVLMNWIKQFYSTYDTKPKFSFSFHSELSHGDYNKVGLVDDDLLEMLQHLNNKGFLNRTLLILMSDHGHRFAEVRETQQGKQEERMPFFSFVFPEWIQKKYGQAVMNFRKNADRLSTPFDIYHTLHDVLHFSGPGKGSVKNRGISLFKEIPKSRTCFDASIEPHWCACLSWEPTSVDNPIIVKAADALVSFINDLVANEQSCATLKLEKIIWAGKYIPTKGLLQFKKTADYDGFVADLSDHTIVSTELYQVKINLQPGGSHFEASMKYELETGVFSVNASDVSRVNKYGKAASCIEKTREDLRKFCYCLNST